MTAKRMAINPDIRYWEWFAKWWSRDFSWEGLRNHRYILSYQQFNLQYHWIAEKDHLIRFAKRRWTRFHLPEHDLDGNFSPKSIYYGGINATIEADGWTNKNHSEFAKTINDMLYGELDASPEEFALELDLTGCWFPDDEFPSEISQGHLPDFHPEEDIIINSLVSRQNPPEQTKLKKQINLSWCRFPDNFAFPQNCSEIVLCNNSCFGVIKFRGTVFENYVSFSESIFLKYTEFFDVMFKDSVSFNDIVILHLSINHALFEKNVSFCDVSFPRGSSLRSMAFRGEALFSGSSFHAGADLAGFEFLMDSGNVDWASNEASFRTLKNLMQESRNYHQAYKFSRLESISRRRRWRSGAEDFSYKSSEVISDTSDKDVADWEYVISHLYGAFGRYGQSALTPILWLVFFWLAFSLIYSAMFGALGNICVIGVQPGCKLDLVGFRVASLFGFPPVSTLGFSFMGDIKADIPRLSESRKFFVGGLISLQILIASSLVFLTFLAIKRRMQIR